MVCEAITAPVFELQEWGDESTGSDPLPENDSDQLPRTGLTPPPGDLQDWQHGVWTWPEALPENAANSGTPPPADYQKWHDELHASLPEDIPNAAENLAQYNLRPAPRDPNNQSNQFFTWLDQDQSGNYNPDGKAVREDSPIKRRREPRERSPDDTPRRPKIYTYQNGRCTGRHLPVKLTFTSKTSKLKLRSFGSDLNQWPDPSQLYQADDDEWNEWFNGSNPFTDDDSGGLSSYELRKRIRRESTVHQYFDGDQPCDLSDITLGYPAVRGCKYCNSLGDPNNHCPLLQEGAKYPCNTCREDNIDCELITQPLKKRACEPCGRRRLVCSYKTDERNHDLPCQDCARSGLKCFAGPASGRMRTGPSLDQKPVKRRGGKACSTCKGLKKWCSLSNKNPTVPCNHCRDNGCDCKQESLRREIAGRPRRSRDMKAAEGKSAAEQKSEAPRIRTYTIRTMLAHPINFNCTIDGLSDPPECHWCDDAVYGLLGLGEVEVEIEDDGAGYGCREVIDGHTAAGHKPSRMCGFCTTDRLRITACKSHEIEPIDGMNLDSFDYGSVNDYFLPGMAATAPFPWCSVCPAPAFFACCKKMEDMGYLPDEIPEGELGCGLLLCEACAVGLVNEHDSVLENLIDRLKEDGAEGIFDLRADADFLHPKGELLRRMAAE